MHWIYSCCVRAFELDYKGKWCVVFGNTDNPVKYIYVTWMFLSSLSSSSLLLLLYTLFMQYPWVSLSTQTNLESKWCAGSGVSISLPFTVVYIQFCPCQLDTFSKSKHRYLSKNTFIWCYLLENKLFTWFTGRHHDLFKRHWKWWSISIDVLGVSSIKISNKRYFHWFSLWNGQFLADLMRLIRSLPNECNFYETYVTFCRIADSIVDKCIECENALVSNVQLLQLLSPEKKDINWNESNAMKNELIE